MPDPISSNRSLQSASPSYDPNADDVGMMSRADAPNSSQAEPAPISSQAETSATSASAVPMLVSSFPPPSSALPPTSAAPPGPPANNNAQRTDERLGVAPYLSAGSTAAGDSVYVGAAMIKGRESGAGIEVLSTSLQVGAQTEVQVGFQRVAGTRGALTGSVETFALRGNVGIHNDDGSVGLNIGATATAVGFEGTAGGASSVTYGVGAGVGAGVSVGARDVDRDGKTEICARLSLGPVTGGVCLENPL